MPSVLNPPPTDDWLALTDDALPVAACVRVGRPARLRRRRAVLRHRPRPRRGPRRRRAPRVRGLRGAVVPRFAAIAAEAARRAGRRSGASRCSTAPAASRVGECVGRRRRVGAAPRRGVRGRPLRDRRAEGVGADLEARDLGATAPTGAPAPHRSPISRRRVGVTGDRDLARPRRGRRRRSVVVADRRSRRRRDADGVDDVPAPDRRPVARGPAPGGRPGAAARRRGERPPTAGRRRGRS